MFHGKTQVGCRAKARALAPALGVTKCIIVKVMIFVTHCCATYVRLKCSTNQKPTQSAGNVVFALLVNHEIFIDKFY